MHAHVVGKPIAQSVRAPKPLSPRTCLIVIVGLNALLWSGIWALASYLT